MSELLDKQAALYEQAAQELNLAAKHYASLPNTLEIRKLPGLAPTTLQVKVIYSLFTE